MIRRLTVTMPARNLQALPYCAIDLETTGFSDSDEVIEIGAVRLLSDGSRETFHRLVQPRRSIPLQVTKITGINNEMLMQEPLAAEIRPELCQFLEGQVLLEHSTNGFDSRFLSRCFGLPVLPPSVNTYRLCRYLYGKQPLDLQSACRLVGIQTGTAHQALDDAAACLDLYLVCIQKLETTGITTWDKLQRILSL